MQRTHKHTNTQCKHTQSQPKHAITTNQVFTGVGSAVFYLYATEVHALPARAFGVSLALAVYNVGAVRATRGERRGRRGRRRGWGGWTVGWEREQGGGGAG